MFITNSQINIFDRNVGRALQGSNHASSRQSAPHGTGVCQCVGVCQHIPLFYCPLCEGKSGLSHSGGPHRQPTALPLVPAGALPPCTHEQLPHASTAAALTRLNLLLLPSRKHLDLQPECSADQAAHRRKQQETPQTWSLSELHGLPAGVAERRATFPASTGRHYAMERA